MNARELDIIAAEAEAEVEAMFAKFYEEWMAERGNQEPAPEEAPAVNYGA